jgi:UDP-N-acetylmuramoylalanine--D-glutamate ligase
MFDFASRRVVVMGLGRFGGGVGVTRFLAGQGARVLVTDLAKADALRQSLDAIADLDVELRLGEHRVEDFRTADVVVVNPAVKPAGNVFIAAALDAGAWVVSEIRLLTERLPDRLRTIGVTGTAGKSTTSAMIHHIFQQRGVRSHLGGNIGGSLLGNLGAIEPGDWIVLELSSFMLEGLAADQWSPHIAVVTNFAPNHLDWHATTADYAAAKQAILAHQWAGDVAILGASAQDWPTCDDVQRRLITEPLDTPLLVPGLHNRLNAAFAVAAVTAALGEGDAPLDRFAGLPHRLQFVVERHGVRWFNDSKSTTPQAAILALEAFAPGSVHLIAGGHDKGTDLSDLAQFAASRCKRVYAIGATAAALGDTAMPCGTLERAVAAIGRHAVPGDVVLLSPGCASWDQFDNYEHRGATFIRLAAQAR